MAFTSFDQIVQFMERFVNLERKPEFYNSENYRLDRMKRLLNHIGNPQNSYKTIHIAGSKGKGSTASLTAAGLTAAGYKTGLYMSPHVKDYRERFTLSGQFIADKELINAGNILESMLVDFTEKPTTFEMYTAFAFLLFKEIKCDYAVIETGLGGRLDATNVITPVASVITPIELEHTDLLGNTIESIATEKSKIIKNKVPVFVSFQPKDAEIVFKKEAHEQQCSLYFLKDNLSELGTYYKDKRQFVKLEYSDGFKTELNLKMLGKVQAQNSALALLVLKTLGFYKPFETEKEMEKVILSGRMEKEEFERPLYLDGAHTVQSIKNLIETFHEIYPEKNGICIFGSVKGKNHKGMAELILKEFNTVIICRPGMFKPSDVNELYNTVKELADKNKTILLMEDAKDALSYCVNNSNENTPILACGSFYLAGVIKDALKCRILMQA